MKLLLDTHLLLWSAFDPRRLGDGTLRLIEDERNELLFSAASIWEVAIKAELGRSDFEVDARVLRRGLLANDWREVSVTGPQGIDAARLPRHHADPFDRVLVAQARDLGATLLTNDSVLGRYGSPVLIP
ncbi:type II toxin-antitoxin system VapC family toxin [Labedella populi]|uniref:Type II toxin-antitoxin system VapC family toxin n=1 Tax=Labedella populi TaxID=2498850 RepID=A0A3S4EBW9_9MICO|nr:type II toxin-antitoxin system VapC family toxin [Labedella populi]RWZ67743.1 type II toxin-antitoxin system VapC family toxin [Labedella populi]